MQFLIPANHLLDFTVFLGTTVTQTQVLQFHLDTIQTQTVCQRSIEVIGLSGNLHLLVRRHAAQCPHIMQTICQFYKQRTDVILHGVQHLLVVIHLL